MQTLKSFRKDSSAEAYAVQVVTVVRNELARLPGFLNHHRRLGIRHFIFVDNNSNDGTTQYLLDQPDTTVLHTDARYGDRNAGQRKWINDTLQSHCLGRWALILDADELFVYDGFESEELAKLCSRMDSIGARGQFAFLMDMYPESFGHTESGYSIADLIAAAPYFDSEYRFSCRKNNDNGQFPHIEVRGGPRDRLFHDQNLGNPWRRSRFLLQQLLRDFYRQTVPTRARALETRVLFNPPELGKLPLIKVAADFSLSRGGHFSTPIPLFRRNAILLHFKLLPDYVQRLQSLSSAGQHWNGSVEQRWLLEAVQQTANGGLLYGGSTRFENSAQLASLELFRDLQAYTRHELRG